MASPKAKPRPSAAAKKLPTKAELRTLFRHRRQVIPPDLVNTTRWKATNHLRTLIGRLSPTVVALYSATDNEIDLAPLAGELWRDEQTVALPRVVARKQPMVFNIWPPHGMLEPDLVGIPAATGPEITPTLIIIPMLGYTREGHRLGFGAGYYDRTLAAFTTPAVTVGVCYTELELPYFPAEAHDLRLNYVVTGKEVIVCP